MPRTSVVECPGCPPLRALTTDVLGLVKVVEARGKGGTPKAVETWGTPDASRGVLAASVDNSRTSPLLAIARKNGSVELLNLLNGDVLGTILVHEASSTGHVAEDDPIVATHLFSRKRLETSSGLRTLLMCTEKGKACLRSIAVGDDVSPDYAYHNSPSMWDVCSSGKVLCSSVDGNENYALFAGKGIEINVWDIDKCSKIWVAKPPPCNSLGIFTPTWFTTATFLSKEDHRKIVACTTNHQVRLYDLSAQRRPVFSVDFRESPIKAVTEDLDGNTIYMGTGSGDLASLDMRTGKLLGCFVGKSCGSIRSIARHPELPVIASCGLDSYLRFWDTKSRQLLSAVFLKQHLTNVVFDSNFYDEEPAKIVADKMEDCQPINPKEVEDEDTFLLPGRSKTPKENKQSKRAKRRVIQEVDVQTSENGVNTNESEENNELPALKRRNPSGVKERSSKSKTKKKKKKRVDNNES